MARGLWACPLVTSNSMDLIKMEFRARLTEWNTKRTRSIMASQDLDAYSFPSQFDFSNRLLTNFMLSSRFPPGLLSTLPSTYSKQVRRAESIFNVTSS